MAQSRSEQGRTSQSRLSQTLQPRATLPQPAQPVSRQNLVDNNAPQLSTKQSSIQGQPTSSVSTPDDKREEAEGTLHVPLWDQACASLRAAQSKHLEILEANLGNVNSNDSLGDRISRLGDAQQAMIRSKDGVRPILWRRWLGRTARAFLSTKDVAMGLARLDHHGVAPVVVGGIFTVIQVIQGATDESLIAMTATLEIGYIVSLWNTVEKRQILRNRDPRLTASYEKLSDAIIQLYKDIIVLLGQMVAYFSKSKLRQIFTAIAPAHIEWKNIQAAIKSLETNCNNVKSKIMHEKEEHDLNSKILKSISSYDIRGVYTRVLEDTGIGGLYSARCQWLVEHRDFEEWYRGEKISVLWLKGTVGTGKTTLMARAIREMQRSEKINVEAKPLAIFFFQKALDPSSSPLDIETCLRSLVRQLSWNRETAMIRDVVESFYSNLQKQQSDDSTLTAGECVKLLKDLISGIETYIMIDAIDECSDPEALLEKLKELTILLNEDTDEREPLHVLLCSRDDQAITDYFDDCLMIATSATQSDEDQTFYIRSEIDRISKLKPGSLFFKSEKRYPDRLEKILIEKAQGLFRWTEIQIQKFTKRFRDESEIEDEFEWLESHTTHPELNKEYARLLDSLGGSGRTRQRAIKMLRIVSSGFIPLSVEQLAEAITASEHGMNCEQLKADDVRRILVGFITEDLLSIYLNRTLFPPRKYLVRLAHSSVIEYLADAKMSAEDFSRLALHSEAARLCFASLRQGLQGEAPYCPEMEGTSPIEKAISDDFFSYSCNYWPLHCRGAFVEDGKCELVQDTSKFILSEGYLTWNRAIYEHCALRWPLSFLNWKGSVCANGLYARPGFVIVYYGLLELLEVPEIRSIVDFQDVNSQWTSLHSFALDLIRNRLIADYFRELERNQLMGFGDENNLKLTGAKDELEVVRRLCRIFAREENARLAPIRAVLDSCLDSTYFLVELDSLILIIELLLRKSANIYHFADFSGSAMDFAHRRNVLLAKYAKDLEDEVLVGAFRAVRRMKDYSGKNPLDFNISPGDITYLESQLEAVIARNFKVVCDFVDSETPKLDGNREEAAGYKEWIERRRQQLEND